MQRIPWQWVASFLVLGAVAFVPVRAAAAVNIVSWNNPSAYSDNTIIPPSLQASIQTKLYYSYDNKEWTLFAMVPNGGTKWTGTLPLAEIVQGFYAITSTIPGQGIESWMTDSIQYPPAVAGEGDTFTVSLGSSTDTYVNQGLPSIDTSSAEPLIGTYTWPAGNVADRGFLQWDLSPLPPGITVTNATLGLYYVAEEGGGGDSTYQVSVAKVTGVAPVLERANWNTYDGVTPWPAGGGGGAGNLAAPESSALVGKTHGWVTWDVTKMVQEWVAAPETNLGMAVTPDGAAGAGTNRFFASRENPDLYPRPQLVVTYKIDPTVTVVIDSYKDADADPGPQEPLPESPPSGTQTGKGVDTASRAFLRWDLSSLPPDATITSATLGLFNVSVDDGNADIPVEMTVAKLNGFDRFHHHRKHRDRHDRGSSWMDGRDREAMGRDAPESSALVSRSSSWVTWDVTRMVREWVATPEKNHGMVVAVDGAETADRMRYFASRDYPNLDLRPQLVVTYQSARR